MTGFCGCGHGVGGEIVGGEAQPQAVRPVDPGIAEREVLADAVRQARQVPAAADIREKADTGLGHGEGRALGSDAVAAGHGDADSAAHDDAVHDRHHGLAIARDHHVEMVFDGPELLRQRIAGFRRIIERADVAAGAEAAVAGAVIGLFMVRYRGIFFGMLNLAFSMVLFSVLVQGTLVPTLAHRSFISRMAMSGHLPTASQPI